MIYEQTEQQCRNGCCDDVSNVLRKSETIVVDGDVGRADHRHEQGWDERDVETFLSASQPYGYCPESEDAQSLVCPCEVSPQNVEVDAHQDS